MLTTTVQQPLSSVLGQCDTVPVLNKVPAVGYTPGSVRAAFDTATIEASLPNIVMTFSQTDPHPQGTLEAIVYDNDRCAGTVLAKTADAILPSTALYSPGDEPFNLAIGGAATAPVLNFFADVGKFGPPFFITQAAADSEIQRGVLTYCVTFQLLVCDMLLDFVDVVVGIQIDLQRTAETGEDSSSKLALSTSQSPPPFASPLGSCFAMLLVILVYVHGKHQWT